MRRVVVTGLGVVSTIGMGARAFGQSLREGRSGISPLRGANTQGFPFERGGEVHDFEPARWLERLAPASLGRSSQFAVAAARMALDDAGLDQSQLDRLTCGVSVGTTDGESYATDAVLKDWVEGGPESLASEELRKLPADRISASVAQEFRLRGEVVTISTACAAGNYALGNAFDIVRTAEADLMLAGGAESMARKSLAAFFRLGAIAPVACQPFDSNRRGIIIGEGSAMLVLETRERALARGARIYAEVIGYGLNCDAKHPVAPDSASVASCMRTAHTNAGIRAAEVDYICAHGTGTLVNDSVEARAIREVFDGRPPPTSSIKSMIGHTMGAASALASAASALALHHGFIPPTINSEAPDPECGLDCVPNIARDAPLRIVQNNAFAFGGNNAIVLFRRHDAQATGAGH